MTSIGALVVELQANTARFRQERGGDEMPDVKAARAPASTGGGEEKP